jgi:hypothetical protein
MFAILVASRADARELSILVLGEAASANCNAQPYGPYPGIFQIGRDGFPKPAKDPLDWADCGGGSLWIPFGREVVKAGLADKVNLMSLGMASTRARDWTVGGRASARLDSAIRVIRERKLKFDYVFWLQGRSDRNTSEQDYNQDLSEVVKFLGSNLNGVTWLIAESGSCEGKTGEQLLSAQRKVGRNALFNRFPGPSATLGIDELQLKDCSYTEKGQEEMAKRWLRALRLAESASNRYQRESLLYYFK